METLFIILSLSVFIIIISTIIYTNHKQNKKIEELRNIQFLLKCNQILNPISPKNPMYDEDTNDNDNDHTIVI